MIVSYSFSSIMFFSQNPDNTVLHELKSLYLQFDSLYEIMRYFVAVLNCFEMKRFCVNIGNRTLNNVILKTDKDLDVSEIK